MPNPSFELVRAPEGEVGDPRGQRLLLRGDVPESLPAGDRDRIGPMERAILLRVIAHLHLTM